MPQCKMADGLHGDIQLGWVIESKIDHITGYSQIEWEIQRKSFQGSVGILFVRKQL